MSDATEMIITTLAVVMAGTVFAIGGRVVLQALRKALHAGHAPGRSPADRPVSPHHKTT